MNRKSAKFFSRFLKNSIQNESKIESICLQIYILKPNKQ